MNEALYDKEIDAVSRLLTDLFVVETVYRHGDRLVFSLAFRYEPTRSEKMIRDRLTVSGYDFEFKSQADGPALLNIDPKRRLRIPTANIVLFVITLFTVYFMPVFLRCMAIQMMKIIPPETADTISTWQELRLTFAAFPDIYRATLHDLAAGAGLQFTAAIISILFVHEMGHFIASRRRGIVTSWPYFIPAPTMIGTFGAVIRSKSPFWNRRDLIEVGAAGPIAGWIVALGWLVYGLMHSVILPLSAIGPGDLVFSLKGESILMHWLTPVLLGVAPDGSYYLLSEAAFAGWVGLLITAINMLPIGQLDGGHIVYGLQPHRQRSLGWVAMVLLVAMGFTSPVWWFFAAFGLLFGVGHPPTLDDEHQVGVIATVMGLVALVILVLSFTPMPSG